MLSFLCIANTYQKDRHDGVVPFLLSLHSAPQLSPGQWLLSLTNKQKKHLRLVKYGVDVQPSIQLQYIDRQVLYFVLSAHPTHLMRECGAVSPPPQSLPKKVESKSASSHLPKALPGVLVAQPLGGGRGAGGGPAAGRSAAHAGAHHRDADAELELHGKRRRCSTGMPGLVLAANLEEINCI